MPDDPPRSPSEQQSDPRPAAGAPAWWGALGRPDLPPDTPDTRPRLVSSGPTLAPTGRLDPELDGAGGRRRRLAASWRAWALNLAVLATAILIICIGVGVVSAKMMLTVGLLFGVPLVLAAITVLVVARRSH